MFSYTPGTKSFTITLDNLLTDINSAAQLITDVEFTTSLAGVQLTASSGIPVTFSGSEDPSVGSAITTGWNAGSLGPDTWLLCVICTGGIKASATPSEGIIPVESSYNVNGSIKTSGSHNPFLESGATFTFGTTSALPSDTSTNPFSDVYISFGTTFGELPTTTTGLDPTPEPLTPMIAGAGLIMMGLTARRRKKNKA